MSHRYQCLFVITLKWFIVLLLFITIVRPYKHLGCFKDASNRSLPKQFFGHFHTIQECASKAYEEGYDVFALQVEAECFSGHHGDKTYNRYGPSDDCWGRGMGGPWANDVYTFSDTPEFIFLPQNTTVTHGSNISLHCQAFSSPPNSILWTRENNTPIKSGYMLYERNFTVVIPNAEKSDAGKYICTAQNLNNSQLNRISRYAYVTVNCPPAVPVITNATFAGQMSVKISWAKPDENSDEVTSYTMNMKDITANSKWFQVGQICGSQLSYTVKDLKPGSTYRFIVTAANRYGVSGINDSKPVTVAVPVFATITPTFYSRDDTPREALFISLLAALLVTSIMLNVVFVVYLYRNKQRLRKKKNESTNDEVKMTTPTDFPSSNINMLEAIHEKACVPYGPSSQVQTESSTRTSNQVSLASLQIPPNKSPSGLEDQPAMYEIPVLYDQTSQDHYEQLNPATLQHDPAVRYEPLRINHVTDTDLRNGTYENIIRR